MLDAVVDYYFNVIELISDKIEVIEEEILRKPKKDSIVRLYQLKRELIFLRKQVWPIRDLVNNIYRSDTDFMSDHVQVFFRDLLDHSTRIIDTVETYRDLMSGLIDMHLSSSSNKMNEIMKFLTIISSIFIPITFIAGIYGMNFRYMPELESKYGYLIVWIIIVVIFIGQIIYFKKKKWL
jgi:magnesium transporter